MGKNDERRQAGASYIINFFNDIQTLNHHYSTYLNFLLELKHKHGTSFESKSIQEDEKLALTNTVQTVRHFCHKIYILYKSMISVKEIKGDKNLDSYYLKIKENFIIHSGDLEKFVISLNTLLVNDIIKDLLVSSQDIIGNIYTNEST